jgi:hypothetical protein
MRNTFLLSQKSGPELFSQETPWPLHILITKYSAFFSHPDYTVGIGIRQILTSPIQPPKRVADYTAGGESHPAPKNQFLN